MSHSRAILVVAVSLAAAACGGAEPPSLPPGEPPPESDGVEEVFPEAKPGSQLQFRIDGRDGPMGAQAQVSVQEGSPAVHLKITGGDDGSNMLMMDLVFDGVANTMGPHVVPFELPRQGEHFANASLDGEWYYSQGGEIDVSLSPEGTIEGRFNVALAPDVLEPEGQSPLYRASDEGTSVTGAFVGRWILSCHSRLAGHSTLVPGGEFCENLDF